MQGTGEAEPSSAAMAPSPKSTQKDVDSSPAGEHLLVEDTRRMLHKAEFHDVVFVCGEEQEEIGACRMFVASRSPVLESMLLSSGMSESKHNRISLPDIEPTTMRICLEFFYTDGVQDTSWRSILPAMKVVKAAMFFLCKRLERLAIGHMHTTSFRDRYEDEEWNKGIIEAYNLGLELYPAHLSREDKGLKNMSNLMDKFRVYVQNRVGSSTEKLFSGCSRERLFYSHLSEMAVRHILQTPEGVMLKHPLTEYFVFLHLVRWSASKLVLSDSSVDEEELEDVLNRCIPRSLDLLASSIMIDIDDPQVAQHVKRLTKQLKISLEIVPVRFDKIPTDIICRFIEPLNVIPRSDLVCTYRTKALNITDLQWDPLGHGETYSIDKYDTSVLSCSKEALKGFARCSTYLSTSDTTFFEWEIVILAPCDSFRIGFCIHRPSVTRILNHDGLALGDERGSWALADDGSLCNAKFEAGKHIGVYADPLNVKEGTIVQVHLDMANSQCSFTINGEEAGIAWKRLPLGSHIVYPAVSLTKPGKVQVRRIRHSWMERPLKRVRFSNPENL